MLDVCFWGQGRCRPNTMELAPIDEAQPVLAACYEVTIK